MNHHYMTSGDRRVLESLCKELDIRIRDLDERRRNRVLLNLSARLCERVAFENAGSWSPTCVADLVQISAQIERKTVPLGDLE